MFLSAFSINRSSMADRPARVLDALLCSDW